MRIGLVSPPGLHRNADYKSSSQVGAIEQQWEGLANELSNLGHEVFIFREWDSDTEIESFGESYLINIPRSRFEQTEFTDKIPTMSVLKSTIRSKVYCRRINKSLEGLDIDIINIPSLELAFFLRNLDIPTVYSTHSGVLLESKGFKYRLKWFQLIRFSQCGDAIVPLNQSMADYLKDLDIKMEVIPNGIEPSDYQTQEEGNYILYGGRLVSVKQISLLIEAFSKADLDNTSLRIIGSGPLKKDIKTEMNEHNIYGCVEDIKPRNEFIEELSSAKAFVLPSAVETFGVVLIEAMASGVPVIANDVPGPRDIISDGDNGVLFDGSVDSLANKLEDVCGSQYKRDQLAMAGRDYAIAEYSFSKVASDYHSLFVELLEK